MIKERDMKNMTMQEALIKQSRMKNFNEDGTVNWNFIDADVYMDVQHIWHDARTISC